MLTRRIFESIPFEEFCLEIELTTACRECDAGGRGEVACLSAGCVRREALCDGKRDCEDGFDESECADAEQRAMEQLQVT